ncbi:MAG: lipopolysaccharide biosynthesis protein [Chitinophagaceae bacterium]|nr:lipopolysaccharide biosynthesis protein [Chitinophagaceae bacterium]
MSLLKKTISGLFWTFTQQFSVQFINFTIQIILARILLPAEFGLIGMIAIFISVGNSLMDSGMTSSLIRTSNASQKDFSTVFWINLFASISIYIITFICAPLIANFYKQPILTLIIRIYTLSFIIRAFVGVQTTILTKEMNFKLQMSMQIPSVIVGGVIGIVMAYRGFGVWSLVWMNLTQSFLFSTQHWIRTKWYPAFIVDRERLWFHLKFGYKLTMSGLLNTIYDNIYNIIIGKFFSATQLGYYTRAQTLQMFPVTNIATALNKVTYPMFAAIQHDDARLKIAYKKLMQQVIFWIAPLMVYLAIVAEPLFRFVLTDKWLPAVPYFQLLCFSGILYPLHTYNLNILNVKGRSDLFLKLEIYKKIFISIGIMGALYFGIYGLLIFQLISSLFAFAVNTSYSGKMINYPVKEQIKDILPFIGIAFTVGALLFSLNKFIIVPLHPHDLIIIIMIGIIFWAVYLSINWKLKVPAINDFRHLILKR